MIKMQSLKKKNPENKLMAQRKGNLHVKDRSSEERDQENLDIMAAVSWSEFPQPQGIYLDEGNGESVPELASPSRIGQGTKFGGGKAPTWAGPYPFWRFPVGVRPEGQPAGYYWAHTQFSTLDLLNWKSSNPSYRDDLAKMTELVVKVFATHHPDWADIQPLLNLCFSKGDEQRLVLDKANGAQRLHQENPDGALGTPRAIPLT